MIRYCIILLSLFQIACQQEQTTLTYFGGGIVQPIDDYVVLLDNDKVIDSIKIDENGRFSYTFMLDKPSLYTFKHGHEPQMIYFEPKDSITLRLNTLEFDESLVFDGTRAIENNFLIENYLLNEKNSNLIFSYYKISPKDFQFKTDSIKKTREQMLQQIDKKQHLSKDFLEIAQNCIDYEYYDMRERYAFLLNKYNSTKATKISNTFFDYRKNIDFNNSKTINLIGYQRFLDNYLKNQSILVCKKKNKEKDCYNLDSYANLDDRIDIVDNLITNKELRNHYFERFIQEEIIYAKTPENLNHTEKLIDRFNFSQEDKELLKSLVKFQSALLANADLKNIKVKCTNLKEHKLGDLMNKEKGVVYSWSVQSPSHHKLRINMINKLKKEYPELKFIGINIDYKHPDKWLSAVRKYNQNFSNEFIIQPEKNTSFYSNYLNKILFINQNCIIQKSEIILDNKQLNDHIKSFANTSF